MTTETKDAKGNEVKVAAAATPKTPTPPALSEVVVDGKRVVITPAAAAEKPEAKDAKTEKADATDASSDTDGDNTEDSASSGEGDDNTSGEEGDDTAEGPKKKTGGFQKRIDKLTRIVGEQQRQLATALKALEKVSGVDAKAAQATIDREDPKPDKSTYDDPEKYTEDLASWSGRQGARAERAEREAKEREVQASREIKSAQETYAGLVAAGKEKYPDWEEVAEDESVEISTAMGYAITRSKVGHDIQYYLGKHPKEAERIRALTNAADQLVEIGKLEAKLIAGERPKVSKAPNPLKPVGGANGAAAKPRHEMSMDEYAAARQPELDAERRGTARRGRTH